MKHLNKIVITLHGIRTRGEWQKKITPNLHSYKHYPLDYGYFKLFSFLIPCFRKKKYNWFRNEYNKIVAANPGVIPSIIVHSFGSLILANALKIFSDLKFDKIILMGSIIKKDYDFDELYKKGRFTKLLNICAKKDICAKVASCVFGAGSSGSSGFLSNSSAIETKDYNEMGHSDMLDDDVFKNTILPFLDKPSSYNDNSLPVNIYDIISPANAGYWSAITYNEQFIERFKNAKSSGYFIDEDNKAPISNPPKKMIIVIPSSYTEALNMERINKLKLLKNITFKTKNGEKRSGKLSSDNIMYDIPSIIGSAKIIAEHASKKSVKIFIEAFVVAIKSLTEEFEYIDVMDPSTFKQLKLG